MSYISVDIDIDDIWSKVTDEELLHEVKKRELNIIKHTSSFKEMNLKEYICDKHGLPYSTDIETVKELLIKELK
jgi:hypothetical protein